MFTSFAEGAFWTNYFFEAIVVVVPASTEVIPQLSETRIPYWVSITLRFGEIFRPGSRGSFGDAAKHSKGEASISSVAFEASFLYNWHRLYLLLIASSSHFFRFIDTNI